MTMLIGLTGRAGSGKSTAAAYLEERHGFVRVRMAGPLKAMMRAIGLGDREIEGDLKEAPCPLLCGRSPRHAMVTLGTEWGRDLIAPDLWVTLWRSTAQPHLDAGRPVVVEDVRFLNEVAAIWDAGGRVYKIFGRAGPAESTHRSEDGVGHVDGTIENAGSIADLWRTLDDIAMRG